MRAFVDDAGNAWEVVLGRESWGRIVAILVPRGDSGPVLEAPMDAAGYEEAGRELDEMSGEALLRLLASAVPKDMG